MKIKEVKFPESARRAGTGAGPLSFEPHSCSVPSTAEHEEGVGSHRRVDETGIWDANILKYRGGDGGWILSYVPIADQFFVFTFNIFFIWIRNSEERREINTWDVFMS